MSRAWKFHNPEGLYFITFATVGWIDVFTRPAYKEIVTDSLSYCIKEKGLFFLQDTALGTDIFALWDPYIASAQDYYPFGMLMPNRVYTDTPLTEQIVIAVKTIERVVTTHEFANSTEGWLGTTNAVKHAETDRLRVEASAQDDWLYYKFDTDIGEDYRFVVTVTEGSCDSIKLSVQEVPNVLIEERIVGTGTYELAFTATTGETRLGIGHYDANKQGTLNHYIDRVVLKRSYDTLVQDTIHVATGNGYRYAFNGMERDDEVNGVGNSYTTHFRGYDSRIGRWTSSDPLESMFPDKSPYNYCFNSPLIFKDQDGDNPIIIVLGFITLFFGAATPVSGPSTDEEANEKAMREAYKRQGNIIVFGSLASGAPVFLPAASVYVSYQTYTTGVAWLYGRAAILKLTTEFTWGLATDEPYPGPFAISDDAGRELRYLLKGTYKFLLKNGATEMVKGYAGAVYRTGRKHLGYSYDFLNESGILESVGTGSAYIKDGLLKMTFLVPESLQKKGIGRQMFADALQYFGDEVKGISGTWIKSAKDGNFTSMVNALASDNAMTLEKAAFETFTGKMAKENGYTKAIVTEVEDRIGNVISYEVKFFKP